MTIDEWLGVENKIGIDIWEKKYRQNFESFDEWVERISAGDSDLKEIILNKEFIFGGRILAGRGTNNIKYSLSNCYVLNSPIDSIEGIYKTCAELARTFSSGGGAGIDISKLRPRGATVNNVAKTTSGAASFMQTFSNVSEVISQHGRRGALMISIDINHPDVTEFVTIKNDLSKVTGANISIRVNDQFMKAVEADAYDYVLTWPCSHDPAGLDMIDKEFNKLYNTIHNGELIYYKRIKPRELFKQLAESNWNYAEPYPLIWAL